MWEAPNRIAFTNKMKILSTRQWVIRTRPGVSYSLFNRFSFKNQTWFPEGDSLPARRLFALQPGSVRNSVWSAPLSTAFPPWGPQGGNAPSGLDISEEILGSGRLWLNHTQTLPWVCSSSSDHSHKFPTLTQGKMSLLIIHLIWLKTKCSSLINGSVFTRRSRTILDVFDVMQDTGARNLVIRTWSQPQTYLALGLWANCVLSLGFLICRFQKKETSQFANTWARTSLTFLLLTSKSCEKYSCLHVPILIVKDFKPQSGNLTLTLGKRIEEFRARNHLSGAQVVSSCLRDEEYEAPKGRWAETRACVSHCCKALVQKQDSYPQPCCVYAEE